MSTLVIGVRRAEARDAEAITAVHDSAWRYAYDGMIPAKELNRIIARRGPRWWDRAIRRGTAILVLEVGGNGLRLRHVRAEPGAQPRPEGRGLRDLHEAGIPGRRPRHAAVPGRARANWPASASISVVVWALADNDNACRFYRNAGGRKVARANERFGEVSLTKVAFAWGRGAAA